MSRAAEQQVAALFIAALDQQPEHRSVFLDCACEDNPALRSRVDHLLAVDSRMTMFLEPPLESAGRADAAAASSLRAGTAIGQFEIVRPIGSGAMGVVYEARQKRPSRTVALKLMNLAVIDPSARRRFEHEAEIMARLHHPGIAQVHEAGVYEERMPWFAMEHIKSARSLRDYVAQQSLDRLAILRLFVPVCEAVHHAHQHGVIHRDLKPANILVDAEGQPKIIDFGVARLTEADIGAATMHTRSGQMIGTPRYMSPEQCAGPSASLIDLRSDVYTLGVILYELLTGTWPYPVEKGSLIQVAQTICQHEPQAPSSVNRTLVGDLEVILLKALEKEPSRRYQSALELANDLRRCLAGEPILARQASAFYVLRRRMRRYRVAALLSLVVLLGVIAFAIFAALAARTQHELAIREKNANRAAQEASAAAVLAQSEAQRKAAHAQSVSDFFTKVIGLADPDISRDRDMTMHEAMRRASVEIDEAFAGDPETEAVVHLKVGRAFAAYGDSFRADSHLRRTVEILELDPAARPDVLYEAMWLLQIVRHDINAFDQYHDRDRIEQLGCSIIRQKDPDVADALTAMHAASMARPTDPVACAATKDKALQLARTSFAPDDPLWLILADQLESANHSVAWRGSQWGLACRYIEDALEIERRLLAETDFRVVRTRQTLIGCTIRDNRAVDAETLSRQAIQAVQQTLPADHWYIGALQRLLGQSLILQDRLAEAEPILLEGLSRLAAGPGEHYSHSISVLNVLVDLYERQGDAERTSQFRRRLASAIAGGTVECSASTLPNILGPEHATVLNSVQRVLALKPQDNPDEVWTALRDCLATCQRSFTLDDPVLACIVDVLDVWGNAYRFNGGDLGALEPLFRYSLSVDETGNQRLARSGSAARFNLGLIDVAAGRLTEAETILRKAISKLENGRVIYKAPLSGFRSMLGEVLTKQGRFDEAEPELLWSHEWLRLHEGAPWSNTRLTAARVLELYWRWDRPEKAEQFALLAVERAQQRQPVDGALLESAAWNIVKDSRYSPAIYQRALQAAQAVVLLDARNGPWLNTLGVAHYRVQEYECALADLTESDALNNHIAPEDAAFLAMTRWQLGDHNAAIAELARLRSLLSQQPSQTDEQTQILAEAQALLNAHRRAPAGENR